MWYWPSSPYQPWIFLQRLANTYCSTPPTTLVNCDCPPIGVSWPSRQRMKLTSAQFDERMFFVPVALTPGGISMGLKGVLIGNE